jgi:hypothetical protein
MPTDLISKQAIFRFIFWRNNLRHVDQSQVAFVDQSGGLCCPAVCFHLKASHTAQFVLNLRGQTDRARPDRPPITLSAEW